MVAGALGVGSVQAQTQVVPSGKVMEVQAADGAAGAGKASASRGTAAQGQGIAQLRRFATRTPAATGTFVQTQLGEADVEVRRAPAAVSRSRGRAISAGKSTSLIRS